MFIYAEKGYEGVNYLDDMGNAEIEEKAWQAYSCLGDILKMLNIWESEDKSQPPAQNATFWVSSSTHSTWRLPSWRTGWRKSEG